MTDSTLQLADRLDERARSYDTCESAAHTADLLREAAAELRRLWVNSKPAHGGPAVKSALIAASDRGTE